LKKWIDRIDWTTKSFIEEFGALNQEQLNWKPNPETWSIAQNIDHLIVINESYYPVIAALRDSDYKPPFLSKLGFVVNALGNGIIKAVGPVRKKKSKTFSIWEPSQSEFSMGILDRFKKHQTEVKELIENSKDLIENGAVVSSPANKNIVYKLDKAFEIMVVHEHRHLEQAKEVFQLMP